MKGYDLTYRAQVDLQQIWNYIAEDSFDAADRVMQDLKKAMTGLVEMPNKGHMRADIRNPRLRCWSVHSYLIIYDPTTQPLQVIRVVSGYCDLKRIFRGR